MENQIKDLQKRLADIENLKQFEADQAAIQTVQMEMLTTLRNVRTAMVSSNGGNGSGNGNAGVGAASAKEMKALEKENERLKTENDKQRYRIDHLVRNVEEVQKKKLQV
mmetsp:Transcript_4090/g.6217  ORF Transcript_4090/g.6217 Transcript_4090/m.6217 type:complete len:109 (+) Transcript_4090:91-417(+)|eukprot:CAMPEP_0197233062 /NCGR_PEP_ID=MMETSP1429-20130617/1229_1 /TAXON_ID=49237 /ORGANISM="Chaetoceros  sp., Strain UNC1202" /LENGTH=108 /DNA_ID=CAMNT_0042691245 /DNA_START=110 /DNA_END=436 /DNA_ORIENTATION=+